MKAMICIILILGALIVALGMVTDYLLGRGIRRKGSLKKATASRKVMGSGWTRFSGLIDEGKEWSDETPHDTVEISSADGAKLMGDFYHNENSKAVIIMVHGYRSSGRSQLGFISKILYSQGYDILMICQRAHGESGGKYITFGQLESKDLKLWTDFTEKELVPRKDIFLYGISMGATTVMLSAGEGCSPAVRGMVADCGFTQVGSIIKKTITSGYHLPAFPFYRIVNWLFNLRTGCDLDRSTTETLKNCQLPVLFIHGLDDVFVDYSMCEENYRTSGAADKEIYLVEGAAHSQSMYLEPEKLSKAVINFLERNTSKNRL